MFRMIVQGASQEAPLQHFSNPIEVESAYLRVCSQVRTKGAGAVKIPAEPTGIIDPAYFRLDLDWQGEREQDHRRRGLWTVTAEGYQVPTPFQLRGAAHLLGLSGEEIARRLGITGRLWRYWLAEETERREIPFTAWFTLREWILENKKP